MYANAFARLDRQRFREAILAARIAGADPKSYAKAMAALEDDAPASLSRRAVNLTQPVAPGRVSLAEQARRRTT